MSERLYVRLHEDEIAGPESDTPTDALQALPVPAALRVVVAHLLSYREQIPAGTELVERVLPDGAVRVIVDVSPGDAGHGPGANVYVAGATLRPAFVRLSGTLEGLSVTLAPGASAAVLGVPAGELRDLTVPLDALWGASARGLAYELTAAPDAAARARILTSALLSRLRAQADVRRTRAPAPPLVHAVRALGTHRGAGTPAAVAAQLAIGERRLQQLFREHVGLTPREWHRLARLHECLRLLRTTSRPRWPDVAVAAGYYDQSHLVNEFRALCGLTPGAFLARSVSRSSKSAGAAAA